MLPFNLPRRDFLKLAATGLLSGASVPWFESLATAAASVKRPRGKACILLWMDGGPSQQHTFDPKPNGEFKSVQTTVPGIHIVEQLPQLSQCMDDMAILRSMKTEINDHYDAKYYLHTGYKRSIAFEHPAIGCIASSQVGLPNDDIPSFVTIDAGLDKGNGGRFYRSVPAYLGPQHAPVAVHDPYKGLENLRENGTDLDNRLELLAGSESRFAQDYSLLAVGIKQAAFDRAVRLMRSKRAKAFNLDEEPAKLREAVKLVKQQSTPKAMQVAEEAAKALDEAIKLHQAAQAQQQTSRAINARKNAVDAKVALESARLLEAETRKRLTELDGK